MVPNLPDISQIGRVANPSALPIADEAQVAFSLEEIQKAQGVLKTRRELREKAEEVRGGIVSVRWQRNEGRKRGQARLAISHVAARLPRDERRDIAKSLKAAFPKMNRKARRQLAFGRGWMNLVPS